MLQPSSSCVDTIQASGFSYCSSLPDDLLVEILLCLPDKQLIRLKCVSKLWYFLISTHCAPKISSNIFCGLIFMRYYPRIPKFGLRISAVQDGYCNCRPELISGFPDYLDSFLPFRHEPNNFHDCCNGLVLLVHCTQFYVCNPITQECISIPPNPNEKNIYVASLLFDINKAYNSPNSFMIAVLRESSPEHSLIELDVFSSVLGSWASHIIPLNPVLNGFELVNRIIYANGMLYMLSTAKYLVSICLTQEKINIKLSSSRFIELPGKDEFDCCGTFGASQGGLVYSNSNYVKILVWGLQNNVQWVLKHAISVDHLISDPTAQLLLGTQSDTGPIKVYGFHPYEEELFLGTNVEIQKYNPRTKKSKLQVISGPTRKIVGEQYRVFPFTRCAVMLNSVIYNNTK